MDALREALAAAFDRSPIGMALYNTAGEFVRVNAAMCELLGRDPGDVLGRRDQELTHPEDRQADLDAAREVLEGRLDTRRRSASCAPTGPSCGRWPT